MISLARANLTAQPPHRPLSHQAVAATTTPYLAKILHDHCHDYCHVQSLPGVRAPSYRRTSIAYLLLI
jgi:hypothetical protein